MNKLLFVNEIIYDFPPLCDESCIVVNEPYRTEDIRHSVINVW